ncbi:MAG: YibE/F family protein [Patescibacteria group bacterium]
MLRYFACLIFLLASLMVGIVTAPPVAAQESAQQPTTSQEQASPQEPTTPQQPTVEVPVYFTGRAQEIVEQLRVSEQDNLFTQKVRVQRSDTGELVEVSVGSTFQPLNEQQLIEEGRRLVLAEQLLSDGETEVVVADIYRLPTIYFLFFVFLVVVVVVGGWQGLYATFGMILSVVILMQFVVPQILTGANPIGVSLIGALVIGAVTIYVAHGLTLKSHLALMSTVLVLFVVVGISYLAVTASQLVGLGSEEAYFLQFGPSAVVNLQGLLLGGIMLGALGVLDDITVSQVSVVFQLRAAKKNISSGELYRRSLAVGKDHVASLVNTLVLAYAGANMPLFLLFIMNENTPDWVTLNSEVIVEEVVRTLAGSIGLVLAVPVATFIASWVALRKSATEIEKHAQSHGHFH